MALPAPHHRVHRHEPPYHRSGWSLNLDRLYNPFTADDYPYVVTLKFGISRPVMWDAVVVPYKAFYRT